MSRRDEMVELLRNYDIMAAAVKNLSDRIQILKQQEDAEENAQQIQNLERSLDSTSRWLKIIDRGMEVLSKGEHMILYELYIRKSDRPLLDLCRRMEIEKSSVYRKRDKALDKLAMAIFGVDNVT